MYKKYWIYIHIYIVKSRKKIKNSLEVVQKQNVLISILLMQGPEYVVLGPIRPFPDTLPMYIIWVYEANVIVLFVGIYRQACSGIPLAVGFVGRDRLLWNSMVQGTQRFR